MPRGKLQRRQYRSRRRRRRLRGTGWHRTDRRDLRHDGDHTIGRGPAASNCDPCGESGGVDAPPGWILCLRSFQIFTPGSAEYLQSCLAQINGAPAYACDYRPVNDCVARMYDAACPSQAAADTCQLIEYALCGTNEPFDVTGCTEDLKPFDAGATQWIEACVASSSGLGCQTAYHTCFGQIMTY